MAAIKGITRITVPAGVAKPSPAIGQALGPLGVNMMEFCKVRVGCVCACAI
jgi:large subunit ribosomal protein L11